MLNKLNQHIKNNPILRPLADLTVFVVLIFGFHYLFRWWAYELQFWPIYDEVFALRDWLTNLVYNNSVWALANLTSYDFTTSEEQQVIYIAGGYVGINHSCSGFKQFLQWIVLMALYPGSWKKKLWYIPIGLVVVHLVNLLRIFGLSVQLFYYPQYFDFAHDYIYRPMFYAAMFALWVLWNEKLRKKS
jgi:exosortase/archaeosortase family protein